MLDARRVHGWIGRTALGVALLAACGGGEGGATDGAGSSTTQGATDTSGAPTASSSGDTTGGLEIDPRVADCLRINACEADGGAPMGLQACLAHALEVQWTWASVGSARMMIEAMNCKLAADDCATVRACTPDPSEFADVCKDSPGSGVCQGDRWVLCGALGEPLGALDCAAAGRQCGAQIWGGCGVEPCEFGVTEARCDVDDPAVLIECDPSGFLTRVDCRTQSNLVHVNGVDGDRVYTIAGETCGFDPMRGANACVGTGEACDFFSQRCDGAVLETCAGGRLGRRDCATAEPAGQRCGFVQEGSFAGAAACGLVEPGCSLAAPERCEGGVIEFCAWDRPVSVDCAAAGYGGCATGEYKGRAIAYCTP